MKIDLKQTETFRKWRLRLKDERARAMIASRLDRLAYGHAGDAEPVGQGISELRPEEIEQTEVAVRAAFDEVSMAVILDFESAKPKNQKPICIASREHYGKHSHH